MYKSAPQSCWNGGSCQWRSASGQVTMVIKTGEQGSPTFWEVAVHREMGRDNWSVVRQISLRKIVYMGDENLEINYVKTVWARRPLCPFIFGVNVWMRASGGEPRFCSQPSNRLYVQLLSVLLASCLGFCGQPGPSPRASSARLSVFLSCFRNQCWFNYFSFPKIFSSSLSCRYLPSHPTDFH